MWAVALVVVVLVVVVVAIALVRRPRGEVSHSVTNYNHALGTLEHLSDRIGPPTVRPVRVMPTAGAGGSAERVVPPVPVRGTDEFPDPDAPIVFDDARPLDRGRPGGSEPTSPARADRAQRMALDSMNHRRRPGTGVMVAITVIVVIGVLAVLGSQKSHKGAHSTSTSTTTRPSASAGATSTTTAKPSQTTRPPPTTLPTQFAASTTSSTGTSATYTVPHTTYQITITGTGPCWVQVDSAATGATVWAGELSTGTVQNVQATGSTTVQFGTQTLSLQVDTIPVVLPTTLRTPFVATFTPSSTATPGSVPASSTTTTAGSSSVTSTTAAP